MEALPSLLAKTKPSECQCAECCFVVLLGWLKGLVKVGSLFDFVFGG
jgi:hypothetical protein